MNASGYRVVKNLPDQTNCNVTGGLTQVISFKQTIYSFSGVSTLCKVFHNPNRPAC